MVSLSRKSFLRLIAAAAFGGAICAPAVAQDYPSRPITLIMPYSPGNTLDLTARALADTLSPALGVPIIVENRPGANGMVGASEVQAASPDGYTLLFGSWASQVVLPILSPDMASDPLQAFSMVSPVMAYDMMIAVPKQSGITSLADLAGKLADPSSRSLFPSFGPATPTDLSSTMLIQASGGKAEPVSYKGMADAWVDAQAGRLTFLADTTGGVKSRLDFAVPLAVVRRERLPEFPDVPTISEVLTNAPKIDLSAWGAVFAPKGTPADVIDKLNAAIREAASQPKTIEQFEKIAMRPIAGPSAADAQRNWEEEIAAIRSVLIDWGMVK